MAQAGTDSGDFRSLSTQMLQNAASREMEARGYQRSDDPDLVINFKGQLEEKTEIESTPAPYYGPGWGYGGWGGAYWGGYGGTQVTTRRYNVGTLVMDVVDREKRQAVYQGGIEGVVTKRNAAEPGGCDLRGRPADLLEVPFRRRTVGAGHAGRR